MKQEVEKAIDECLSEFDFKRVHKVMTFLKWKWRDKGVPKIYDLVKAAEKQLIESYEGITKCNSNDYCVYSGGFVSMCKRQDNDYVFELYFVLTSSESEFTIN